METPSQPRGYCAACSYPLQGLVDLRCPECGRPFDPANPRSFRKSPHSRLTRWLVRPIGWPVVLLSLIGCIGVMCVSRWKLSNSVPSTVDLVYYFDPSAPLRNRTSHATWRDYVFTFSMLAAAISLCWWMLRLILGLIVRLVADYSEEDKPVNTGRRHALVAIASIITASGAAMGWPYRMAQGWVARLLKADSAGTLTNMPPTALSAEQTRMTLRSAVIQLPRPEQRIAGLKLLIETNVTMALPILTEAVTLETDSDVRSLELRLIGLHRDPETADLLQKFLTHGDANTRAASADALGILHAPAFHIPLPDWYAMDGATTTGNIRINLAFLLNLNSSHPERSLLQDLSIEEIPLKQNIRDKLQAMMLGGPSTQEREAAARAILTWPPDSYKLRVAEWGVWIDDKGKLKLFQSLIDEIPPFVHRSGNPLDEFNDRLNSILIIDKPIIHITVDRPMAVDVNVVLSQGRPWFVFPMPDDFDVRARDNWPQKSPERLLLPLENTSLEKLSDLRQGYPWITPSHPRVGLTSGNFDWANEISSVGVRWQSIVVSPALAPGITPPDVGTDAKFAWWKRLRDVPSSWVTNRGETERFLYYDGPTLMPPPVTVSLSGNKLKLSLEKELAKDVNVQHKTQPPPQGALLIHHRQGRLSALAIPMPAAWDVQLLSVEYSLPNDNLHQDEAIQQFRTMLTLAGLTAEEAEGLVASWLPQFFQTDGTRLLMIMSRQDYHSFCPIEIRPTPTELVRVGIILTELQ